jgi:hypothetical protein
MVTPEEAPGKKLVLFKSSTGDRWIGLAGGIQPGTPLAAGPEIRWDVMQDQPERPTLSFVSSFLPKSI